MGGWIADRSVASSRVRDAARHTKPACTPIRRPTTRLHLRYPAFSPSVCQVLTVAAPHAAAVNAALGEALA